VARSRPTSTIQFEYVRFSLTPVVHRIRRHWPKVAILVRGDGHYCAPEVLDLLRKRRCGFDTRTLSQANDFVAAHHLTAQPVVNSSG
jgi:Transposase DDE domain group 1